ncbi:MAG: hypothetical protein U0559_01040, partial [Anaerolineae bacterium]
GQPEAKMADADQPIDEIVWVDENYKVVTESNQTRLKSRFIFADGSILELNVTIKALASVPAHDKPVLASDIWNLTDYEVPDPNGDIAAARADRPATATRCRADLIDRLRDSLPERRKQRCPICHGRKTCTRCYGAGCSDCDQRGRCPTCHGRGVVLIN